MTLLGAEREPGLMAGFPLSVTPPGVRVAQFRTALPDGSLMSLQAASTFFTTVVNKATINAGGDTFNGDGIDASSSNIFGAYVAVDGTGDINITGGSGDGIVATNVQGNVLVGIIAGPYTGKIDPNGGLGNGIKAYITNTANSGSIQVDQGGEISGEIESTDAGTASSPISRSEPKSAAISPAAQA